jgi:hypothetical protein
MRARAAWLVTGAIVTVVSILAGTGTVGLWLARQTDTQHHTYQLATSTVILDLVDVDAEVVAGDGAGLAVERRLTWATTKPVTDERWDGRALVVAADCPSLPIGPRCEVAYTLRVPPGADLAIRMGSGDLTIRGIYGGLSVSASSADVRATGLGADDVTVHTRSGDVDLSFTEPPRRLDIVTGAGDVELTVPPSTRYRVDTDADQPSVAVPQDPEAAHVITVHTDGGSLHIRPSGR